MVSKRTFLQQFLPEVELAAPFSLAAAQSLVLRLAGLGVRPGFPRKNWNLSTSPGAGSINALKFECEVVVILVLGCLWLCSSLSCSGRLNCVSVLLFIEQGYGAKSALEEKGAFIRVC